MQPSVLKRLIPALMRGNWSDTPWYEESELFQSLIHPATQPVGEKPLKTRMSPVLLVVGTWGPLTLLSNKLTNWSKKYSLKSSTSSQTQSFIWAVIKLFLLALPIKLNLSDSKTSRNKKSKDITGENNTKLSKNSILRKSRCTG